MTQGHSKKVVGILGGMGPAATVDLLWKILRQTPATKDEEHLRILVDINPQVPGRVTAILEGTEDPGPVIAEMSRGLERAGAELLAIACNTAHYYWQAVQEAVRIPVLHMIRETARYMATLDPIPRTAGLLASVALIKVGLYQEALREVGITVVVPSPPMQERVLQAIASVKGGESPENLQPILQPVLDELGHQGAECIVAGCTEIPIALLSFIEDVKIPFVDASDILAQAIVRKALTG